MKRTYALLLLVAVTMSGCFVDRYHDRGRGEGGYERDRDHGGQQRNRDNHDDHREGDRGGHDRDH